MVETIDRIRANWMEEARRDGLLFPQSQEHGVGWKSEVLEDLKDRLDASSQFPCVFSINAYKKGLILFHFVDDVSDDGMEKLASALRYFVTVSRHWDGTLATANPLVVAFSEKAIHSDNLDGYQRFGWDVLSRLRALDPGPWPGSVSTDPESSGWSMCFDEMPIFCNMSAPTHRRRHSRNLGRHFVMVINPRERFDVFAGDTKAGRRARSNIRQRLELYDEVPHAPQLATYATGGLEWPQYALPDDNMLTSDCCPFRSSAAADRYVPATRDQPNDR